MNTKYIEKDIIGSKEKKNIYHLSPELKEVVNLTILLKERPLLLMGEPGCGKTRLAEAVAYELYGDDYEKHYFRWDVKSTSKAQDGIYSYDALKRLNDVQLNAANHFKNKATENEKEKQKIIDVTKWENYMQKGALWETFEASKPGEPAILLIDEIDKANIDFPNDLLLELDKKVLRIPEIPNKKGEAKEPPLIFITSNQERELPAAFLRRCLYHYIEFPNEKSLIQILESHFSDAESDIINKTVTKFLKLRKEIPSNLTGVDKQVSTSELIDWFKVIHELIKNKKEGKIDKTEKELLKKWTDTKESLSIVPFYQILIKNFEAREIYLKKLKELKND